MMKQDQSVVPYFLLLFGSVCAVWFVTISCRFLIGETSKLTPESRNEWLIEWLEEPICQPPCFLGITPGTTTVEEASRLLSSNPDVRIVENPLESKDYQELTWDFSTRTTSDEGRLGTDETGNRVAFIDLDIGSEQRLTLAEIMGPFGTPDNVSLHDCRGNLCVVHLIYTSGTVLELALQANLDPNKNEHTIEISPDITVENIWFLPPGEDGYREVFGAFANYLSGNKLPWNGYTTYTER